MAQATAAIRSQREQDMKATLAKYPRIIDLIGAGAKISPQTDAVVYMRSALDPSPVIYSHDELMGYTKACENWFRAKGIGKKDPVAVMLPLGPAAVAAIWGASACGIAEPMNLLFSREAIIAQLREVNAKLLLVPPPGMPGGLFEKVEGIQKDVPSLQEVVIVPLDGSMTFSGQKLVPDPSWQADYGQSTDMSEADRVAVMLPTGGTTGHPKVAQLTNRNMVASCASSRLAYDIRPGDRLMVALPLFHVGGLFVFGGAGLAAGATKVITGPAGARDPAYVANFWKLVQDHRLTHAGGVPTTIGAVSDVPSAGINLSTLRVVPTGAAVCPPEIERRFLENWGGSQINQIYGMTELAGGITHDFVGETPRPESVGTANPMVELAILVGDKLHQGPWPSPLGELLTRGPQVFAGYVNPQQTKDAFHDGWLRTGDLCQIDADGYVSIKGRVKDVIIRGGHNIDPLTIEDAALAYPGVALAAAVGRPDAYAGEVPMLFVVAQPGVEIDQQELAAFVQGKLMEPPARPRAVKVIQDMPVTPIGKIFKPGLRQIAALEAANELLKAEGLGDVVKVETITDPARGLVVQARVAGTPDVAEKVRRLLTQFPVKVDVEIDRR